MVYTSAFGTGVDTSDVRISLHVGGSYSIVDFTQETGRAGRDGHPSDCITIHSDQYAYDMEQRIQQGDGKKDTTEDVRRWLQLQQWVRNHTYCRKYWLYSFMDGVQPGVCIFDPQSVNCDICDRRDGSPLSEYQATPPSIAATPDTARPWNYSRMSQLHTSTSTPSSLGPPSLRSSGEAPAVLTQAQIPSLSRPQNALSPPLNATSDPTVARVLDFGTSSLPPKPHTARLDPSHTSAKLSHQLQLRIIQMSSKKSRELFETSTPWLGSQKTFASPVLSSTEIM